MKILHFELPYQTNQGEHIELCYAIDRNDIKYALLHADDGICWKTTIHTDDCAQHIRYAYRVTDCNGNAIRNEQNCWRMFYFNHRSEILFIDSWADDTIDPVFLRSAFSQCIMKPRGADELYLEHLSAPCLLLVHALPPSGNYKWAVVGNTPEWGNWDPRKARLLQRSGTYEWSVKLNRTDFKSGIEYKYILVDPQEPKHVIWEKGNNRSLRSHDLPTSTSIIRQDEKPNIEQPLWKGVGCVIPVFSLKSQGSFGIGDFGDLRLFVRWAAQTALNAVQLLPINDTTHSGTWRDSYPYNGISVFALHPIYLDAREWKHTQAFKRFAPLAKPLNELPAVDYEAAFKLKTDFTKALFEEIGSAVIKTADFKIFKTDNEHWLNDYTRFCAYRDYFHTSNFREWPLKKEGERAVDAPELDAEITYYKFVQFLLHRQLQAVHNEAQNLGVILKGDIPIGICPNSVAAWVDSHLFHFDGQAGAPPDDFAVQGQNWGFPTYNWEAMALDGYAWWRRRFEHMKNYFDAYRIDHVLGFFRIWEIPSEHIYGILGRFRPALPFTKSEVAQFGFSLDPETYATPHFSAAYIDADLKLTTDFKEKYLEQTDNVYRLKHPYNYQQKINELVSNEKERDLLLQLSTEVLFIADPEKPQHYHPRIAAQHTRVFAALSDSDKHAFNKLHDNFFYERHNQFWADEALKKIPPITQCRDTAQPAIHLHPLTDEGMLPCAEDLGMVPASVKGVLERLRILSLEIQRMPKTYGGRFDDLRRNPYFSVATIATHDMAPLRLWWLENREQTQTFWHDVLHHGGEAPDEASPEICEDVVTRHIQSPSMLCLLSLQDLLAISPSLRSPHPECEQINVPANPNQYWRYRMHLNIEELIQATAFNDKLISIIERERNTELARTFKQ